MPGAGAEGDRVQGCKVTKFSRRAVMTSKQSVLLNATECTLKCG